MVPLIVHALVRHRDGILEIGGTVEQFPQEMVMTTEESVDASFVGLDTGKFATIRVLPDQRERDGCRRRAPRDAFHTFLEKPGGAFRTEGLNESRNRQATRCGHRRLAGFG
jgi:hypothetical protein